jgi:single-strand DNA-binding protein
MIKMSAYNHVTLVGNLTKDPEQTYVNKKCKSSFTVAVERYYGKDKESEVDYFNIITWGKLAEVASEYLVKGKKVLIDGRIQVRSYETEGVRKWITEIIAENLKFLSPKGGY